MPWQILMLFQNLLSASFSLLSRKINKKIKGAHFQVVALVFTVIVIFGLIFAVPRGGFQVNYLFENLQFFIFAGICFGLTNVASYKVFQYLDAGIATILSTLNTLAAVIIATFLIHEGLTVKQAVGALVVMLGIWLVMSIHLKKSEKNRWLVGLGFSVAAALFFGLATTTEKHLLNIMPLPVYILFGWGFQWLAAMCLSFINKHKWRNLLLSPVLKTVIGAGLVRAIAGFLFILALVKSNNVSIIAVLSGVKAIFVVILADLILKERKFILKKVEAALLVTAGVAIMLIK